MAEKKTYDIPVLEDHLPTPKISEGALAHVQSHPAKPELQEKLGFPTELVDDWEAKAVAKLGELLEKHRSLSVYLDSCVKCGSCSDKCQFFLGSGDPKNMPVARQDLLRKIYRKYFTVGGKLAPDVVGAVPFTKDVLDEWYTYFHQCSQCKRCSYFCPYGIDTAKFPWRLAKFSITLAWARSTPTKSSSNAAKSATILASAPKRWSIRLKVWKKISRTKPAWPSACRSTRWVQTFF